MRFKRILLIGFIVVTVIFAVYVSIVLAGEEYGLQRYGAESGGHNSQWQQECNPNRYGTETAGHVPETAIRGMSSIGTVTEGHFIEIPNLSQINMSRNQFRLVKGEAAPSKVAACHLSGA